MLMRGTFTGNYPRTLEEVGHTFGVSREHVRRVEFVVDRKLGPEWRERWKQAREDARHVTRAPYERFSDFDFVDRKGAPDGNIGWYQRTNSREMGGLADLPETSIAPVSFFSRWNRLVSPNSP
jgi:hypothetical protein